jgi:hypothetical protein
MRNFMTLHVIISWPSICCCYGNLEVLASSLENERSISSTQNTLKPKGHTCAQCLHTMIMFLIYHNIK